MATITIEVPDELSPLIAQIGDRLPELLMQSLDKPALPAHVYKYILDFLASNPSAQEIADFKALPEMAERVRTLMTREEAGDIADVEKAELDECERVEHLMVMIKAGNLHSLTSAR